MSIDDIAHHAFTAQAFTGHPSAGIPEGYAKSGVFALYENQPVTTEIEKCLVEVLVHTDFATTYFLTGGSLFLPIGNMTLAESADSPRYGSKTLRQAERTPERSSCRSSAPCRSSTA